MFVADGEQPGQGCTIFCDIEPVTPLDGDVKLSWTESLNWPMALAATTRPTVVPFRKVVVLVMGVHKEDDCLEFPISTVKEKSGPTMLPGNGWNKNKIATAITAMIIVAATIFFRLLFDRIVPKSRFHF